MDSLKKVADNVLKQCMNLQKNESLLILFDKNKKKLAEIFLNAAKKISKKSSAIEIPVAKINREEPPKKAAQEMKKYNVVLLMTTKSLSHTDARRDASKKGARIASMPRITIDMAKRTLSADYKKIDKMGKKIISFLKNKKTIILKTELGTNIRLSINPLFNDNGLYHKKGAFGNLPAGEIGFAPVEKKTNGTIIIDKTMAGIGKLSSPLKLTVENGYVKRITGKDQARKLKYILQKFNDENVYNIAEFAIGTNYKAKITGATLEDEKVFGTIHIALGDNTSYKGGRTKAPTHLDGIISRPTMFADGKLLMKEGRLLV